MDAFTNKKPRPKRSPIWFIPKDELEHLISVSSSIGEVLQHLDLINKGGNYRTLRQRCLQDNIDLLVLKERSRAKTSSLLTRNNNRLPIEKYLIENASYNRTNLKRRLIGEGFLENKCAMCGQLPEWNGKPLVLQLDHINGISNDNRLDNLRILCPHCHSQTDNFAGKAKRYAINQETGINERKVEVAKPSVINPEWRHNPKSHTRKVVRPSKEDLAKLLWEKPTSQIAKDFGVSDHAVAKWAKTYELAKPPRGYWQKKQAA